MHFCRMQAPRLCAAPSTRAPLQSFSRWARRTQGAAAVDLVAERRAALHAAGRLGLQLRLARLHGLRLQHLRGGGGAGRGLGARRALSTPCRNHPGRQGPPARAPNMWHASAAMGPSRGAHLLPVLNALRRRPVRHGGAVVLEEAARLGGWGGRVGGCLGGVGVERAEGDRGKDQWAGLAVRPPAQNEAAKRRPVFGWRAPRALPPSVSRNTRPLPACARAPCWRHRRRPWGAAPPTTWPACRRPAGPRAPAPEAAASPGWGRPGRARAGAWAWAGPWRWPSLPGP